MTEPAADGKQFEEIRQLRERLKYLEEALRAIRSGEGDAPVEDGSGNDQVFTLTGAPEPYRVMIETMSEGAVTLTPDGRILYANECFANLVGTPRQDILGAPFRSLFASCDRERFDSLLAQGLNGKIRAELLLQPNPGLQVPVMVSLSALPERVAPGFAVVITDMSAMAAATIIKAQLAQVIESSNDAIISLTLDAVVKSWNRAAENLFGYTIAEAIGRPIASLIVPPGRTGEVSRVFDAIRRNQRVNHTETIRQRKDGTLVDVDQSVSPMRDAAGVITGVSAVFHDISERKQTETTLRQSEDKFRYLFEQSPVAKSITEASGLLHVNQAFCTLLGYSPKELQRLNWSDISHPDDIERTQQEIDALLAGTKESAHFSKRYLRKNGAVVWAEVTTALRRDSAGQPLHFMTTVIDITERKNTEMALLESESRFRQVFEKNGSVMLLVEPSSGDIVAANQAAATYYGYTPEHLMSMRIDQINALPAEEIAMQRQLALDEKRNYFNFRHRLACGAIRDVEVYSTPIDVGHRPLLFSIVHDITERVLADRRIEFLANHDRLTELPNRGLFYDRLSQTMSRAIRKAEPITVFLLDLDNFKPINDRFGHEAGDVVLKLVARRLQSCIREMDTVARLGGDEFGIILGDMGKAVDASALAEKIIGSLSAPVTLKSAGEVGIGVSIGIAIYPENGSEIDTLIDAADRAMYESKAHGKNTYTFSRRRTSKALPDEPWIQLDDAHLLGYAVIDQQHQMIADLLNKLNVAAKQAQSVEVLTALFDDAAKFTAVHFETEERLMEKCQFPDQEAHKNEHKQLLEEAQYLRGKFAGGSELLVLQALKDWFVLHIESFDKPLAEYLIDHQVEAVPATRPAEIRY